MLLQCQTFMFDCDGTLWNQGRLIDGSVALIEYLRQTGRRVLLLTNNSTQSIEQYHEKCLSLGLPVEMSDIVCTANVLARHLSGTCVKGPLYVIGEAGICRELDKVGISYIGPGPELLSLETFTAEHLNPTVTGVVVGMDFHFNYVKLLKAASYIQTRGLPFYATNEDAKLPSVGYCMPGTGSLVQSVRVASGAEPIVFGKPQKKLFDFIVESFKIDASKTIMVGDRLDTDIKFGNAFGMHTACVLTGVTEAADLTAVKADAEQKLLVPDLIYPSVRELFEALVEADRGRV